MTPIRDYHYQAITIISPMYDGEEKKDQDRAVWFEASQTACVCDGVTSSPYAVEAADLVTVFSPAIFSDDVKGRLRAVCDLLTALRAEKLHSEIHVPSDVPVGMQGMLQDAARQSIEHSHQTTLVAARFTLQNRAVMASVVRCGDGMFLGFDSKGQLLTASPANPNTQGCSAANSALEQAGAKFSRGITFGAGDELLAKVLGTLTRYPRIAEKLRIQPEHRTKWLVCRVLDKCSGCTASSSSQKGQILHLGYGERVVVPRYLAGRAIQIGSNHYVSFLYSRTIRTIKHRAQAVNFHKYGAVTAVLPDHFYTGNWTYFRDRFPADAQFVLGSDGFYGCFKDAPELWCWLNRHKQDIQNREQRKLVLNGLHEKLRKERSDDDISFVWVYPRRLGERSSQAEGQA